MFKFVALGEETVKIQLWDLAGSERFKTVVSSYYRSKNESI